MNYKYTFLLVIKQYFRNLKQLAWYFKLGKENSYLIFLIPVCFLKFLLKI